MKEEVPNSSQSDLKSEKPSQIHLLKDKEIVVKSNLTPKTEVPQTPTKLEETSTPKGVRFWLIFLGICLAGFVSSTDATIIFIALPTITRELNGQENSIWLGNAYVFATTAIQPLYGQISNIFGRRYPMIFSVALFALGSGIAGGAHTSAMFIAGRLVQGMGAGGMIMLIDLIVCDLVPLRERSTYLGIVLGACAVGTLIGPVIGGAIVSRTSWKWVFWINLPVCALTLAVIIPFLRVSWKKSPTWKHSLARIDYLGNAIFIASITSILLGLIQGGLAASPLQSGINILPINGFMIPSAAIAGALLTKTGKYKPLHWIGFALLAIATGLFSTMTSTSSKAAWACFQILAAIGIGFPLTTQLPAIQAVLPESDTAISTSTYSFIRSFGFVWGASIPSIVFNSRINAVLDNITDADVRTSLANGGAYAYANNVKELSGQTLQQTLSVYASALRTVWYAGLAFSLLGFLAVFVEKHVDMRVTLDTEFGLEGVEKDKSATGQDVNAA
ncbi:hypothetical protein NHQ30_001496 [Ciborinia camelliae]|nr:hypothetical protein NHQ30_001496 [Ciborinia camelliae]